MRIKYELPCVITGIMLTIAGAMYSGGHVNPKKNTSFSKEFTDSLIRARISPAVQEVNKTNNGLRYTMKNGAQIERIGGTVAWRNNNPGCIRYSSKIADMGAIGKADGFAVFPNEEIGMRAIKSLLLSDAYRDLNISTAIHKYAPPHENNTARYINSLCGIVGVSQHTKLRDLNDEQMTRVVHAIRTLEGWIAGTELKTNAPRPECTVKLLSESIDKTKCIWMHYTHQRIL